ncbi:MAG: hypothetical protein LBG84_08390 [Treponema sp.]|jgi:hypothetical protein|nr:hypothetical protein [Treponema sp.]
MDIAIEFNPAAFKHGVGKEDIRWAFDTAGYDGGRRMARMTDEEADYWDEYYTKNPPVPGPNKTGVFTQRRRAARSITIDGLSADWLMTRAIATHKTPADIIGEMAREKIAATDTDVIMAAR